MSILVQYRRAPKPEFLHFLHYLHFFWEDLMASKKKEILPIKLNRINFSPWSFHFYHFFSSKSYSSYLEGSIPVPTDEKALVKWNQNNSKVLTWILIQSNPTLDYPLIPWRSHQIYALIWSDINQVNKAQKFYLDTEFAKYTKEDNSVQEYYRGFLTLWSLDWKRLHLITVGGQRSCRLHLYEEASGASSKNNMAFQILLNILKRMKCSKLHILVLCSLFGLVDVIFNS